MGVGPARRATLAQRGHEPAIRAVVRIQRQEAAEPPEIAPTGGPPPVTAALRPQTLQVQHDLDRAPIALAQVHHPARRVFRTADRAGEM
jgi:hypothetical protein